MICRPPARTSRPGTADRHPLLLNPPAIELDRPEPMEVYGNNESSQEDNLPLQRLVGPQQRPPVPDQLIAHHLPLVCNECKFVCFLLKIF